MALLSPVPNVALLRLADYTFRDQEAPEEIGFGAGEQAMSVTTYIGGKRIIQVFGDTLDPIQWSGIIRGADAELRTRQLARMRAEGNVQRLTYLSFAFDVVVKTFKPNIRNPINMPFTISVEVQRDVSGVVTVVSPSSIDAKITEANQKADLHLQNAIAGDPQAVALQPSYNGMVNALEAAGPAAQASGVTATLTSASITKAISDARAFLIAQKPSDATQLGLSLTQYLQNLQIVERNFNRGQAPKTISLFGGNLYDVSSENYGDAGFARDLMQANGLNSPFLPSGVETKLVIPPLKSS